MTTQRRHHRRKPSHMSHGARRGVATLWVIVVLPVLVILLCVMADLANLWLARVELENSLEAAALASAKEWGNSGMPSAGWTTAARNRGVAIAAANTIGGNSVTIDTNLGSFNAGTNPNENDTCTVTQGPPPTGNLVFGRLTTSGGMVTFDADDAPSCPGGAGEEWGVRAKATVPVNSLTGSFMGATFGPYSVSAEATAAYTCATGRVRLIRVDTFNCP